MKKTSEGSGKAGNRGQTATPVPKTGKKFEPGDDTRIIGQFHKKDKKFSFICE